MYIGVALEIVPLDSFTYKGTKYYVCGAWAIWWEGFPTSDASVDVGLIIRSENQLDNGVPT